MTAVLPSRAAPKPFEGIADTLARLPRRDLFSHIGEERRRALMDLMEVLLRPRRADTPTSNSVQEICERINAMGLPLDRYVSSTNVLTPEHDAMGRVWVKDAGVTENVYVRPPGDDPNYTSSPFFEAVTRQRWVEVWLPDTPDDRFGIVPELKAAGYTHYLCVPFILSNQANGWFTVATKAAAGFSREDLATFALLLPVVARIIDARVGWATLDRLLRTYVGDEPHRAILDGNVKRGQVSTIRSAILFADMRDSTGHTAEISAVQAVALFNAVFDRLVPPIESRKGEVLKYMGDGLLAIFRGGAGSDSDAAEHALAAAQDALANVEAFNAARPGERPLEVGIALHFGEAAYGNIGSGLRLDFTVIGRDIGLASRIGAMNARLGEPLLLSEAFVERLRRPVLPLGAFAARGFSTPLAVFKPVEPDKP